jgi:hypothetical protein
MAPGPLRSRERGAEAGHKTVTHQVIVTESGPSVARAKIALKLFANGGARF